MVLQILTAAACGCLQVYKAQAGGVQTVAVKIFTDQARAEACSGDRAAEFRREIAILKGCRDRNIVQFIGACLQEGRTILVTGETLAEKGAATSPIVVCQERMVSMHATGQ